MILHTHGPWVCVIMCLFHTLFGFNIDNLFCTKCFEKKEKRVKNSKKILALGDWGGVGKILYFNLDETHQEVRFVIVMS